MLVDVTPATLPGIRNKAFAAYARTYVDIEQDFMSAIAEFGLPFADVEESVVAGPLAEQAARLADMGVRIENDRKSFVWKWLSPACLTCRRGVGTETFLTSTQCPRNCFFCFNPNQEDYEYYQTHVRDVAGELEDRHRAGVRYRDLALTGGEPLLHPDASIAFFERASELYPDAYTRLYTSGSGFTPSVLDRLEKAGLDEIRFSVKMEDSPSMIEATLAKLASCVGRIPHVMVEMPVMPDQAPQMQELLLRLDALGADGINLLELCFPLHNDHEFRARGYRLKARPYRVLYNYIYAGGLPVHGSERACIELLEFAAQKDLRMGVHYCSLENKYTGQVYLQNLHREVARPWHARSDKDHFFKSARAFGPDAAAAEKTLRRSGETRLFYDRRERALDFPCEAIPLLRDSMPDAEIAVSLSIAELRENGPVLRELALQVTTPAAFDMSTDF